MRRAGFTESFLGSFTEAMIPGSPLYVPPASAAAATKDATSNIYVPQSAAEYALLGLTAPNQSLWLAQEASGNLADSIGSATLTASGSAAYQQTVSGWATKAVKLTEAGANKFTATIPDGGSHSLLVLMYVAFTASPGAQRTLLEHPAFFVEGVAGPLFRADAGSAVNGASNASTTVHAMVMRYDRTNTICRLYTEAEKIQPTYDSAGGTTLTLGGSSSTTGPMQVLYMAAWKDSTAEMADATVKTMLQTLGWTVAW